MLKNKKLKIVILILIATLFTTGVFIGGVSYIGSAVKRPASNNSEEVRFSVKKGEQAEDIAKELKEKGLITNKWIFITYLKYKGKMGFLQAGDYVLKKNLSIIQVMDVLTQGKILQSKITIPEGWTNKQIEDEVVKKGIGSKKDFENDLAGSHEFKFLKESPNGSLEGFLFPDTYLLSSKPTSKELIQKMLSEFGQKADPKIMAKASETGLSYYQVLVLSSIVEREVISKEDRRKVAGVFLNRLKNDMKLDSDATVEFVLNSNKRILSDTDIAVDSPYNTYKNKGLPPGPIGNPGIESIESVLTFEKNDYLYFFSGKDGKTYFSKTQEEHEEKKAKYL